MNRRDFLRRSAVVAAGVVAADQLHIRLRAAALGDGTVPL